MLIALVIIVFLTTVVCEVGARREWLPYWIIRKILHVVAVGACAVATLEIDRQLLTDIVTIAEILLIVLVASGKLMRDETGRLAWGVVWFPLAFLMLLLFDVDTKIVAFSMAVLAICDASATVAGKLLAKNTYQLTGDSKSLAGNVGFVISFIILYALAGPIIPALDFTGVCCIAVIVASAEAVGSRGLDNITVPISTAFLLGAFVTEPISSSALLLLIVFGAMFALLPRIQKSLTGGGIVAAVLLAVVVAVGSRSVEWLLPLFVFFGSSLLIGRIFPANTIASDAKHQQPRDATQVFANGSVYGFYAVFMWPTEDLLYFLHPQTEVWLLSIMAMATADTWSSEIGQHFKQPTYDLLRWQKVPPGLSGGVSIAGTLAGLAGAAFLVGCCFWLLPHYRFEFSLKIILFGFLGMLLDSLLGSLLQAKYLDSATNRLSDTPSGNGELVRGYSWVTNDLINFLAILIGVTVFSYLMLF
ncbi:DUF92 domain-containing protein [Neolewinella agarilytica]|uniref:TIGR00297 family protein n=1 Tax=Neolewinella agarilytica TaxID=478744 RepID=A0A1H9L6Z3_9BACT|nr:DUF92 domain-containing protein [Neolewinella agarilytica]SER06999.1 TIGR00297 family protein [Neolewinella agarilytica]